MKTRLLTTVFGFLLASSAMADMKMYEDYEFSDTVTSMTTVKVSAGKGEEYLEGLKQTWVASNEVAKELGHLEDYRIYVSTLPESGDFNVVLIITFKNLGEYAPSRAKYDEFMKKWSEKRVERNRKIAENYPNLRELTGEYLLNSVKFLN